MPENDQSVRIALIGCGRIAEKYSSILSEGSVEQLSLTAVADNQEDRAQRLGERHGVPFYADFHAMMQAHADEIDLVCILTPSGLHAEHMVAVAPYGKHVLVEKPMALTIPDADRMITAADRHAIKLFVVKQNRFNRPVQRLRQAFDEGRFGRLVMGSVRVRWCRHQSYYDQDAWRGTWQMDGGVFSNQASHHIDLLEWFLGRPVSVFAKSRNALADIEAEDTGVATITFESGAIGIVEATTATRPKDLEGSLSILGEKGTVEIGGFAVNEMRTWNFADEADGDAEAVTQFNENPPNVYGFGHVMYLRDVVHSITNDSPSLVDGLEGRKSLELIMAIYESIESGKEVPLMFQQRHARLGKGQA